VVQAARADLHHPSGLVALRPLLLSGLGDLADPAGLLPTSPLAVLAALGLPAHLEAPAVLECLDPL